MTDFICNFFSNCHLSAHRLIRQAILFFPSALSVLLHYHLVIFISFSFPSPFPPFHSHSALPLITFRRCLNELFIRSAPARFLKRSSSVGCLCPSLSSSLCFRLWLQPVHFEFPQGQTSHCSINTIFIHRESLR